MGSISKSPSGATSVDEVFAEHPVLTLDTWDAAIGGSRGAARAKASAKYYTGTGRLRRLTRGLYAVVPPGQNPQRFAPDPYLVAAALRGDAVLSHHTALDLLGAAHSTFNRFPYTTESPRRTLRVDALEWPAVAPPVQLVRAGQVQFGVRTVDRRGVRLRLTGPERTLVDGFAAPRWVGGLEELVESAAGFRDLDPNVLHEYLRLLDRQILYAALGWFLTRHPEVADGSAQLRESLLPLVPKQPLYLERQRPGGKVQRPWNVIVPAHLALDHAFEGAPR